MRSPLPNIFSIRQNFPVSRAVPIRATLETEFEKIRDRVKPDSSIALAVGSRGITNIATIVRTLTEILRAAGARPFIIPAMGSHGGASGPGQAELLATYDITEETMSVPIRSSLEVRQVATTGTGLPVVCSVDALAADAILVINRVKPHTDFQGRIGSGLLKICVIGLGKKEGAALMHAAASRRGHEQVIREMARTMIASVPILGGVAILEDHFHETAALEIVPSEQLDQREEVLLSHARDLMPSLPFEEIDLLIVDRIGKNISGAGMDPNVTGRWVQGYVSSLARENHPAPFIRRIFVRELTLETHGNAIGIGMADVTTTRLVQSMDHHATYINALTSLTPQTAKIPIHFPTDRECLEETLVSLALANARQTRIVRIQDTLSLSNLEVSEALSEDVAGNRNLTTTSLIHPIRFDDDGNLNPIRIGNSAE